MIRCWNPLWTLPLKQCMWKQSSLVLIDEDTDELLFHVTEGEKAKIIKTIRMKAGEGIVGWVIKEGKPVLVNDVSKDKRFYKAADKKVDLIPNLYFACLCALPINALVLLKS